MTRKRQTKRAKRKSPASSGATRKTPAPKRSAKAAADLLKHARAAALPHFVTPCLATLVDKAPDDKRWLHEIKFDGYRIQARLDHGKVKLMTRKGLDWTKKFPGVAESIGKLNAKTAVIDGEMVVEDAKGVSRFSLLQQDLSSARRGRMRLYAFDLMHLNGADLKPLPLFARKVALGKLIHRGRGPHIRFSKSLGGHGPVLLKHACKLGLEGIISKLADAPYHSGRGRDWLKAKCSDRQEFVVTGFTPSTADAHAVGALVLGVYRRGHNKRGHLQYSGRVGTGFTHETARKLYRTLKAHARKTSPFKPVPKEENGRRAPVWVEPKIVVEVDFHGWTGGDRVRQGSFQGVRRDKSPKEVVHEVKH
jgi:bifunctional non-homologous end joining protein LigD